VDEDKETKDVIAAFSLAEQKGNITKDIRKVRKAQEINVIRKSNGYMKFINKFKK